VNEMSHTAFVVVRHGSTNEQLAITYNVSVILKANKEETCAF